MGIGSFVKPSPRPQAVTGKRLNLAGIDMVLFVTTIAISVFGLLMVYSTGSDYSVMKLGEGPNFLIGRQILWLSLGSLLAIILTILDYRIWKKYAIPMIIVITLSLIATLFVRDFQNGAYRTLIKGSIHPSDFAKIAIILYLSVWLNSKKDQLNVFQMGLLPLSFILGLTAFLINSQPDFSAAVTIILLGVLLFFLANGDIKQITLMVILALVSIAILSTFSGTGQNRVGAFVTFIKDPSNPSPQLQHSLGAIVNGKWFGTGLGRSNSALTVLESAPFDSIFAVVVEETGLIGAICLIGLYGLILWRGIKIAMKAPDMLGSLMAAGLTFWIIMEAAIHMGVIVGLLPIAGTSLPFISAGGSNLVTVLVAIGILMNISRQGVSQSELEERRSYSASVDLRGRDGRRRVSRPRRAASNDR
jgi:cell division protein FtsW